MKIVAKSISFSFIFILLTIGCETINEPAFESYNNNVSSTIDLLENEMNSIEKIGLELFALESSIGFQDILDAELNRDNPYEISYDNPPYYVTVTELINSIKTFNSFYKSYSSILYSIASNNSEISSLVSSYNNALNNIAEDIELESSIAEYSITSSSLVLNFALERISYPKQVEALKETSVLGSPIILEMINVYISIIDNLEFTVADYYSRYLIAIENLRISFSENISQEREEKLNLRLIDTTERYRQITNTLKSLRESFVSLRNMESELYTNIQEENIGEESLKDFVMRNYDLYWELQ